MFYLRLTTNACHKIQEKEGQVEQENNINCNLLNSVFSHHKLYMLCCEFFTASLSSRHFSLADRTTLSFAKP